MNSFIAMNGSVRNIYRVESRREINLFIGHWRLNAKKYKQSRIQTDSDTKIFHLFEWLNACLAFIFPNSASLIVSISITRFKDNELLLVLRFNTLYIFYLWIKFFPLSSLTLLSLARSFSPYCPIKSKMMIFFIAQQYNERYHLKASLMHQLIFP